jgi:hypothetical protein
VSELAAAAQKIGDLTSSKTISKVVHAAGMAAKKESLDQAAKSLGGDRAMSGFKKGRAKLNVGFDEGGSMVTINYRPAGAWKLAESGRKGTKLVKPRRGKARAFLTPAGPRASFVSQPSRGLRTLTNAQRESEDEAIKAARDAFGDAVRSVF